MQEQPQQQETSRVGAAEGDNMTEKVVYVISVPPASGMLASPALCSQHSNELPVPCSVDGLLSRKPTCL